MVIVCAGAEEGSAVGGVSAETAEEDADKFSPPITEGEFCCAKCLYVLWRFDDADEFWYKLWASSGDPLQSAPWTDRSELHNLQINRKMLVNDNSELGRLFYAHRTCCWEFSHAEYCFWAKSAEWAKDYWWTRETGTHMLSRCWLRHDANDLFLKISTNLWMERRLKMHLWMQSQKISQNLLKNVSHNSEKQ